MWNADGTIASVTPDSGPAVYLGAVALGNGVYRLLVLSSTVVVGNAHTAIVTPAEGAVGNTGDVYVGGVQVEDAPFPSSYIRTAGASAAVRNTDALRHAISFGPTDDDVDDFTVYVKFPRPFWADMAGSLLTSRTLVCVGATPAGLIIGCQSAARNYYAQIVDGSGNPQVTAAIPAGGLLEVAVRYAALAVGGTVALDAGAGFGAPSAAALPFAAFAPATLYLGSDGAGFGSNLMGILGAFKVARGLYTTQQMREML